MIRRSLLSACVPACLFAVAIGLSACGGGGGDSGGSSGTSAAASLTVDPAHLTVTVDAGRSWIPTAAIYVTLHNGSSNGTYVGGNYTDNAITGLDFTGSDTVGTVTISFKDPSGIGLGTYSDSVQLAICTDSSCTHVQSGSELIIPVTYTVTYTAPPVIAAVALSANPTVTGAGMPTTLTWSSTNAQSCVASGEWSGTLPSSGSQVVTSGSLGDHIYTLNCAGPGDPAQTSATVTAAPPIVTLSAFPRSVILGKTITLRWQGQYAASCVASGAWTGSLPAAGFRTLSLSNQGISNFHLVCSNSAASGPADTSVTVGAAPIAPPATAYRMTENHDGVLITSNSISHPSTSTPTWTVDFGAPVSYPLIADGMVFVSTANPNGSYGIRLYGLNALTGATVWGPVAIPGTDVGSGLTYDSGRVFILMFDGTVRAFNGANGAALWSTQLPGYWYGASPNAYGGTVFVIGNGGLSALDEASGAVLWTTGSGTTDRESPAVSSEGVYTHHGSCLADAYDPVFGSALWHTLNPCNYLWGYTSVVKNGIVFGRAGSTLNLFDAVTGSFSIQLASARAPAVTNTAVIALNAGTLSSTRLSDLVQTWTFTGDGNLITAPVVVNNTVFVGSASGKVYGLNAGTGSQIWMGLSPLPIGADSEDGGPRPPSGPAAGENLLIFPAGNSLVSWQMH